MSARLQKLHSLPFCFSRRGLNYEINSYLKKVIITKKTEIRGIGSEELICVFKTHLSKLSKLDKEKFESV
jgi:hypothetical protein